MLDGPSAMNGPWMWAWNCLKGPTEHRLLLFNSNLSSPVAEVHHGNVRSVTLFSCEITFLDFGSLCTYCLYLSHRHKVYQRYAAICVCVVLLGGKRILIMNILKRSLFHVDAMQI